ncbi:MAG: hypothetical protein HYZ79_06865 [Candidatus Melainabacteria bacterium]|nr:hypothetical protein [Candidatus Melainabacteria bacterium]
MSSTTIAQPIISTNIASASRWVGFDINGHPDLTSASQKDVEKIALQVDKHYALWNRLPFKDDKENNIQKGLGPGLFIALFETATAWLLQHLERTPATFTNLFTTLAELAQVIIANVTAPNINLDEIKDEEKISKGKKKQELLKTIRENSISGVITAAGAVGLYRWAKETIGLFKDEEPEISDLSLPQKSSLSVASFLSAIGMFVGYGEKVGFAPISVNGGDMARAKEMRSNGNSDKRCSIEWLFMTAFPFLVEFKLAKAVIDFVLPAAAFLDGTGDLYEWAHAKFNQDKQESNHHTGCNHGHHNHECNHGFSGLIGNVAGFVKKLLGLTENGKKLFQVPKIFFNKLFFGNSQNNGIRSRFLTPIYQLIGCDPPECYMKDDKLMIKVPDKYFHCEKSNGPINPTIIESNLQPIGT